MNDIDVTPIPTSGRIKLYQWVNTNRALLINTLSLVCTTAVTGVLGFAYWWIAAREFPPQVVGLASAAVSAMTLLGAICVLGLGTLLIGELPRQPGKEWSLINAALLLVGGVGACGGVLFVLVAPYLSADFQTFRVNLSTILLFAVGVSLTSIVVVLDQALIGLLQGSLQFWRNTLFAMVKLVLLFLAGLWLAKGSEIIYGTWAAGNLISLIPLFGLVLVQVSRSKQAFLPDWKALRKLGLPALQHHLLNLILQAPITAMPVLVTIVLSATTNAWFYVAWMLSGLVFIASYALTTVLYAINASQSEELSRKIRLTLGLSLLTAVVGNVFFQFGATQILNIFGHNYAEQASWSLRILSLGAFPMIIKNHYIAVGRIYGRITRVALPVAIGSVLELGAAALGARLDDLVGLSVGWVVAVCIEVVFMFPSVYKAAFSTHQSIGQQVRQLLAVKQVRETPLENESA